MDSSAAEAAVAMLGVAARVDPSRLRHDARLEDVGVAWHDVVQTVHALEIHYGIDLPINEHHIGAEVTTVGQFASRVAWCLAAQDSAINGQATLQL